MITPSGERSRTVAMKVAAEFRVDGGFSNSAAGADGAGAIAGAPALLEAVMPTGGLMRAVLRRWRARSTDRAVARSDRRRWRPGYWDNASAARPGGGSIP